MVENIFLSLLPTSRVRCEKFPKALYVRRLKMKVLALAHGQIMKISLGWVPLT